MLFYYHYMLVDVVLVICRRGCADGWLCVVLVPELRPFPQPCNPGASSHQSFRVLPSPFAAFPCIRAASARGRSLRLVSPSPGQRPPCSVLPSVHLSACGYFLLHLPVFCHVHSPFLLLNQQLPRGKQNSYLPRGELSESYHFGFLCLWRHRF